MCYAHSHHFPDGTTQPSFSGRLLRNDENLNIKQRSRPRANPRLLALHMMNSINSKKLIELEALRGIAAIVVLLHHFMLGFAPTLHGYLYPEAPFSLLGTPAFAFVNGSAAVIIFFVLSGFVLTIGLLRTPNIRRGMIAIAKRWPRLAATVMSANLATGALMAFALFDNVRAAQLVPSAWLALFYNWQSSGLIEIPSAVFEGAMTFFNGHASYNSNLWTMYYEFWGSLIAIGCATVCSMHASHVYRIGVLSTCWLITFRLSPYLSTFVVGVWLADHYNRSREKEWSGLPVYISSFTLFILLGYHESFALKAEGLYNSLNSVVVYSPLRVRVVIHSLAATLAMLLFLRVPAVKRNMSGRTGRLLGFMSFGIYLAQIAVICSASSWTFAALPDVPYTARILLTLAVTIAVTILVALPLAFFDRAWVRVLGRITQRRRV